MLYSALIKGSDHIERFLSVDSLPIKDAHMVAILALDIIIVYKSENIPIPRYVRQCIEDYRRVFIREVPYLIDYEKIIDSSDERKKFVVINPSVNGSIDQKTLSRMLLLNVNVALDLDMNRLIERLIMHLNKCNYIESATILLIIKHLAAVRTPKLSSCEINALAQAESYLNDISNIIDIPELTWEVSLLNSNSVEIRL